MTKLIPTLISNPSALDPRLFLSYYGPSGTSGDEGAVAEWLDYLLANEQTGYLDCVAAMDAAVSRTVGRINWGIVGTNRHGSRLVSTAANTEGTILVKSTSRGGYALFENFKVEVLGNPARTFAYSEQEGGAGGMTTCELRGVTFFWNYETGAYPILGPQFNGHFHPIFDKTDVIGRNLGLTHAPGSTKYSCLASLDVSGAFDPRFDGCYINGGLIGLKNHQYEANVISAADNGSGGTRFTIDNGPNPFTTGYMLAVFDSTVAAYNGFGRISTRISETQFDINVPFAGTATAKVSLQSAPESFRWDGGKIENTMFGVDMKRRSPDEPDFHFLSSHINSLQNAIKLEGVTRGWIAQNTIYGRAESGMGVTVVDFDLIDATQFQIVGNQFFTDTAGTPAARTNIRVRDDGDGASGDSGIIAENIFAARDATSAVVLDVGATGWQIHSNRVSGNYSTPYNINNQFQTNSLEHAPGLTYSDLNSVPDGNVRGRFEVGSTNKPGPSNSAGSFEQETWNANSVLQRAHLFFPAGNANQIWTRVKVGGVWGAWAQNA